MEYKTIIENFFKGNFNKKFFSNHSPFLTNLESSEVKKCLKTTFVSTAGKYQDLFVKKISKILKTNYIIPLNSGTSALHIAMILSKLGKDDEVLMPSLTFVATANSAVYVGASPHFVDICKKTLTIDFEKLESHVKKFKFKNGHLYNHKSKKKIKALVLVHTYGFAGMVDQAKKFCKKYNLIFIEDAAESLASFYNNKHTGTFGDFGCLSFNGNKVITTGAGGLLITKKKSDYLKGLLFSDVGKKKIPNVFDFSDIGYNYKMPSLNAALGCGQLKNLNKIMKLKFKLHNLYKNYFRLNKKIIFYTDSKKLKQKSNYWLNTIFIDDARFTEKHQKNLLISLNKININLRPTWKPLHTLRHLKHYSKSDLSTTNYIKYRLFNLPSSPDIILYEKK